MARRKRNSARVNLIFSVCLHTLAVLVVFFFAAREGLIGKKLEALTVALAPKAKPKEEVKPPEPPKIEPPKDEPKPATQAAPPANTAPVAPPAASEPSVAVAPPAAEMAAFDFSDGAKVVESSTNAQVAFYKNCVEYAFRSHWDRPALDVPDDSFVAEIEVQVDAAGKVTKYSIKKNSGNKTWDDSVIKAIESAKNIGRLPPTNFPPQFIVRFDVQPATENLLE